MQLPKTIFRRLAYNVNKTKLKISLTCAELKIDPEWARNP